MPITKSVSSRSNIKQATGADFPVNPAQVVTVKYGPVSSTAGQTVINLSFAVDQSNKTNFFLSLDGKLLSDVTDFTFTSIASNNTSSQITLNFPIIASLNIQAWYLGVVVVSAAASSILTLQAQANTSTANGLALLRNYLINGGFDFFQRASAATNMGGSLAYQTADRFAIRFVGTFSGTPTSQSSTTVPTNGLSSNCILFQGNSTNSSAEFTIEQRIESTLAAELAGQQVSFSMQALTSMQSATIELYTPSVADNYTTETLQATATVTGLSLGAAYGLVTFNNLTVPAAANLGLAVRIRIFNNSVLGSASTHRLTQMMLNVGPSVSGFKRVGSSIQAELTACQRYYEAFGINPVTGAIIEARSDYIGKATSITTVSFSIFYKTTKRVAAVPAWPAAANWQAYTSSTTISASANISAGVNGTDHNVSVFTAASGFIANTIANVSLVNNAGGSWAANAEI